MHLYDVSVSAPGPAFDRALRSGPKLLAESRAIFESVCAQIRAEKPDFVLVCGDMTKDGERSSRRLAAAMLAGLRQDGMRVSVVPGNHDILNPRAQAYAGDTTRRVDAVSARELADIYADCGYGDALERDPAGSMSYVAAPTYRDILTDLPPADNDCDLALAGR